MRDEEMELAVPLGEGVLVVDRLLAMRKHLFHVVEIPPRRMQHGKPRGEGLDREPRLDQLDRAHLIGKVGAAAVGCCRGADESSAAEATRDESSPFELV